MTEKSQYIQYIILEKANRLIYTKGYNSTSLADVATAAGITKGNLHYHYRSKDELLNAVIAQRKKNIIDQLAQWQHQLPDAKDKLRRFTQMLLNEKSELIRYGCPMGSLNQELGKNQAQLKSLAVEMFDLFQVWLENAFKQLALKNAKSLSLHLLSMAQGAVIMSYVYENPQLLEDEVNNINRWIDAL